MVPSWCYGPMESIFCISHATTVVVLMLTIFLIYLSTQRRNGVPPGPRLWPIIGNIPSLITKDVFGKLQNLRFKYGDIYGLYVGTELSVVLNGFDVINEVLVKKGSMFSVRPVPKFKKMIMATNGIVFANGIEWKKRRAFSLKALNDICFHKQGIGLEEKIREELEHLVHELDKAEQPIDPKDYMDVSFANIMFYIIHARRIGYTNEDFKWFMNHLKDAFSAFARNQVLLSCFGFLDGFPFDPLRLKQMDNTRNNVRDYHRKMAEPNFQNYKEGGKDCLIDCYVTEKLHTTQDTGIKEFNEYFDDTMWNLIHDMVAAGSETCATTFNWILLHLVLNPDVKQKLHDEIDNKFGKDDVISLAHRNELPYVQATVLEGFRIGTVVPLALPHGVKEDTMFRGYLIPKGAQVYANLASVLKDPDVFQNPETFNPDRFLSKDGKSVIIPKEFIAFSAGPRSCTGETLAKQELFLYTATLFHKFDVFLDSESNPPSTDGEFGVTYQPSRFKVNLKRRHLD